MFFDFPLLHLILISSNLVYTKDIRVLAIQELLKTILVEYCINPVNIPLPDGYLIIFEATLGVWERSILVTIFDRFLVPSATI